MDIDKKTKRTMGTFLRFLFLGERKEFNPHPPNNSWRWWHPARKHLDKKQGS